MSKPQPTWSFSLVLGGISEPTAAVEDALYEAGCDDALLVFSGKIVALDFDRAAESFERAVLSAIEDVERSETNTTVLRVSPDDLVSAADIARRMNVSREAARNWIDGLRGGGGFPAPLASVGKSPVWSWWEVATWLLPRREVGEERVAAAQFTAALNRVVEQKRMAALVKKQVALEKELQHLRMRVHGA